jgi:hypothetical protein
VTNWLWKKKINNVLPVTVLCQDGPGGFRSGEGVGVMIELRIYSGQLGVALPIIELIP